jgi:feruloyl esterase
MNHRDALHGTFSIAAAGLLAMVPAGSLRAQAESDALALAASTCTSPRMAESISPAQIGEPVSAVVLDSASWVEAGGDTPAHCMVTGRLEPVDRSATARPIRFGVALPAEWNRRAVQMGGGGMNGSVPRLAGASSELSRGFVTYGSDSGHSNGDDEWTLNDEAIRNLGFMQMKKTHDVAMVLIERAYGELPAYNYYVGGSQGGREGQMVAQRYPEDYDGVVSAVPIVGFSSLMLAPTLTRIQEIPLASWVPPTKGNAILAEFMRRCDDLDGLVDGIISNYVDCRAIFNVNDGIGESDPWSAKRCPDDVDPDPEDASQNACLTSGQIETVEFVFSDFAPDARLPNGRTTFGMWAPATAVGNAAALTGAAAASPADAAAAGGRGGFPGGGLFNGQRFLGQEGAPADARPFVALGSIGVNGFMMQDIGANPLDYDVDVYRERREQIAAWLDTTDPDLGRFRASGGRMIVVIGTDDTIASSGEQLNYYQTLLDAMGREAVDSFARLYVLPQSGHGLSGRAAPIDGEGNATEQAVIPSSIDWFGLLRAWVESDGVPGMAETVTSPDGSLPLCSYPQYPHYRGGNPRSASAYECASPVSY